MEKITIFDIIKDKIIIEKLNRKIFKIRNKVIKIETKIENTIIIPSFLGAVIFLCFFFYPFNLTTPEELRNGFYKFEVGLGYAMSFFFILIGSSLFSFFCFHLFNIISSCFRKNKKFKYLHHLIYLNNFMYPKKLNQFLNKFENSLSENEIKYIVNFSSEFNDVKKTKNHTAYYKIFKKVLYETEYETLLNNKKYLIGFFKENFNLNEQKVLIDIMTKIIKKNSIKEDSIDENVLLLDQAVNQIKTKTKDKLNKISFVKSL